MQLFKKLLLVGSYDISLDFLEKCVEIEFGEDNCLLIFK